MLKMEPALIYLHKVFGKTGMSVHFFTEVFNPLAPSNCRSSLNTTYRHHENIKKRAYEERIREIEHYSFTPLAFSATGGMAPVATVMYKRLASLLAEKCHQDYSKTITWIRTNLSFSLLKSAVMCLRGARSSFNRPARKMYDVPLDGFFRRATSQATKNLATFTS